MRPRVNPPQAPIRQRIIFKEMLSRALSRLPLSSNSRVWTLKVENVVKAPRKPMPINELTLSGRKSLESPSWATIPSKNEPVRLTAKVP